MKLRTNFGQNPPLGETTENTLLRLTFHDCIPYLDGGMDDRLVFFIVSRSRIL